MVGSERRDAHRRAFAVAAALAVAVLATSLLSLDPHPTLELAHGRRLWPSDMSRFADPRSVVVRGGGVTSPRYVFTEDADAFRLELEVPGLKPDDMKIDLEDGGRVLHVGGARMSMDPGREPDVIDERFDLGWDLDTDKIAADLSDDVLLVNIPKRKEPPLASRDVPIRQGGHQVPMDVFAGAGGPEASPEMTDLESIDVKRRTRAMAADGDDGASLEADAPASTEDPALADVAALTERVLSTTFGRASERGAAPRADEIPVFWSIGGAPRRGPAARTLAKVGRCFPGVAQAGCGRDNLGLPEGEVRAHANDLRVLRKTEPADGEGEAPRDGAAYVNVDLCSREGVRRAADLGLLFPERAYPVVYEDGSATGRRPATEHYLGAAKVVGANNPLVDDANPDAGIAASKQVQFVVTAFLPESLGLFAPPPGRDSQTSAREPRATVHGIMLDPKTMIGYYHQRHEKELGGITMLELVASPSIIVNNYVVRTLSGQTEEGSPVTEAHLEVAKNVVARKVRLWAQNGGDHMIEELSERYHWHDRAMGFYLRDPRGPTPGMDCAVPPLKPKEEKEKDGEAPKEEKKAKEPKEEPAPDPVKEEIHRIIAERNALDNELHHYIRKMH